MPQEPDAQMNHDVPSISRRATEKLPETRENGEGRSASRDAPATMGEKMRLATKDHIEHIEHDGEMDWEERRLTGDGSPYLVGMPVAGRDERPRSSAVGLGACLRKG